jgi:NADP-dependent 3-hydroxy acid dehydrogenase YdfG
MGNASSAFAEKYGPWALVTGASDGIGRAFAVELAPSMALTPRLGRVKIMGKVMAGMARPT